MFNNFQLVSHAAPGIGLPEGGCVSLIYAYLLQTFHCDVYRQITVNHIGDDMNELVLKKSAYAHVNIRYAINGDFGRKDVDERNRIRLDIIHTAMLQLAAEDSRIESAKLEAIREIIIKNNFRFDIPYKSFENKKYPEWNIKVVVRPSEDVFRIYAIVENNSFKKCELLIYSGVTTDYYFDYFFSSGKWVGAQSFILSGKKKEQEIRILLDECQMELVNLTNYPNPPFFTLLRKDISAEEKEKAHKDFHHSLPPAIGGFVDFNHN